MSLILLIPVSMGELVDKIAILRLKARKLKDPAKLKNVHVELRLLEEVFGRVGRLAEISTERIESLESTNELLWRVIELMKEHERSAMYNDSYVALARQVNLLNDRRSQLKRSINLESGSEIIEEKSDV